MKFIDSFLVSMEYQQVCFNRIKKLIIKIFFFFWGGGAPPGGYGTEKTHVSNRKTDKIGELFSATLCYIHSKTTGYTEKRYPIINLLVTE